MAKNNNSGGDGVVYFFIFLIAVGAYLAFAYQKKMWPFKPKEGDECEPDSDDEDENADEYEYEEDPDDEDKLICSVKECKDGWLLSAGACVAEDAGDEEDEDESTTCPYGQYGFYSDPDHCTDVNNVNIELGTRGDSSARSDLNFGDYFYAAGDGSSNDFGSLIGDDLDHAERYGFFGDTEYKYEKKWWVGTNEASGELVIQEGSAKDLVDGDGIRSIVFVLAPIYEDIMSTHVKNGTRVLVVTLPSKRILKNNAGTLALSDVVYDGTAQPDIDDACKFVITEPTTNDLIFTNGTDSFEFRNVRLETDYVGEITIDSTYPVPDGYSRPIAGNATCGATVTTYDFSDTAVKELLSSRTDPDVNYVDLTVGGSGDALEGHLIHFDNIDDEPFDRSTGLEECARLCSAMPENNACTGFAINSNSSGGTCKLITGGIEAKYHGHDGKTSSMGSMCFVKSSE